MVIDAAATIKGGLRSGIFSDQRHADPDRQHQPGRPQPTALRRRNTYEVALNNASVNFLGFHAGGSVIIGVSDGVFQINVPSNNPISLSFFGLGGISVYGYFQLRTASSASPARLGFDLGQNGNELWGSISITISNNGFSRLGLGRGHGLRDHPGVGPGSLSIEDGTSTWGRRST